MKKYRVFQTSKQLFKNIFLLLSILVFSLSAQAQLNVGSYPDWIVNPTFENAEEVKLEDVSDGYIYTHSEKQVHLEKETSFFKFEYKIYTTDGVQNASRISVEYDPAFEKLIFHELYILRDGEKIDKLDKEEFKIVQRETNLERHIYDGTETAFINLQDVRVGDVIGYTYSLKGFNPIYNGHYSDYRRVQFYDPLPKYFVRYVANKDRKLNLQFYQSSLKADQYTEGAYQYITIKQENIEGKLAEGNVPSWYFIYPYYLISDFETWEELNKWATSVFKASTEIGKELKASLASIKDRDLENQTNKIDAIISFVQDDIRYFGVESGIGGYKPHSPEQVLKQRFGDCKDKSLLLATMLQEYGIEAYPALVSTTNGKIINQWIPYHYSFNHCIVKIIENGKTYWIDPTINNQGGVIENTYCPDYGYALVLDGKSKELEKMEVGNAKDYTLVKEIYGIDDFVSPVSYMVRTEYYGRQADIQRADFANQKLETIQQNYLNFYSKLFPEIKSVKKIKTTDKVGTNVFIVEEEYEIDSFWTKLEDSKREQKNAEFISYGISSFIESNVATANRKMPYAIYYPLHYTQHTIIDFPDDFSVENEDKTIEHTAFTFNRKVERKGRSVFLTYDYQTNQDHIEADELKSYASKQSEVYDLLTYSITYTFFDEKESADINIPVLLFALIVIGGAIYGCIRLDNEYNPEPVIKNASPEVLGGWLVLVAIGMIFRPINIVFSISEGEYFNDSIWSYYLDSDSIGYDIKMCGMLLFEVCFNFTSLIFSVYLAIIFFKQRTSAPKLISIYFGLNAGILLIYEIYTGIVMPELNDTDSQTNLFYAILAAAIWIPYFYNSSRVKRTFLRQKQTKQDKSGRVMMFD